jgi:hypothetical protein
MTQKNRFAIELFNHLQTKYQTDGMSCLFYWFHFVSLLLFLVFNYFFYSYLFTVYLLVYLIYFISCERVYFT